MHHKLAFWLTATFLLVACANTSVAPSSSSSSSSPPSRGKIALLLPESKTTRYESQDLPNFTAHLRNLGFDVDRDLIYSNANQDAAAQQQQAEAALTNGASVLVLDPVDSDAATAIVNLARARGAKVIAYDRLVLGSEAVDYYISFDNIEVGRLQAEALLSALRGIPDPAIVMLNGSPLDNNTTLYKQGAYAVLRGRVRVTKEATIADWSPDKAQEFMAQTLTALGNRVDGVYAANDGMAGGAIAAMKAAGLHPLPPITGQDAELAAIQRILVGEQYMTVYKAIQHEAIAAATLAFELWQGQSPDMTRFNSRVNNGKIDVPTILLKPLSVTRDNIKHTIMADKFWHVADVCTAEYVQACLAVGINPDQTSP